MNEHEPGAARPTDQRPRKPKSRRRNWVVNLLIITIIFVGVQWWKARPLASGEAPALRGPLTSSDIFDLADWRGTPVLVHFWATWCPICKMEQGSIDALSDEFNVITVAMQSGGAEAVNGYLQEQGLDFPAIADPYGEIATTWGVQAVPASFVLDGSGRIRFSSVGYTTGVGLRGRLWAADQME
jgi:thiol-disulfide isomerase/thioredoxin